MYKLTSTADRQRRRAEYMICNIFGPGRIFADIRRPRIGPAYALR